MNPRTFRTLGRSALRSARYLLRGRVRFPRHRLGSVLELPDGETFVVYRETALDSAAAGEDGVVLVFRLHVADREVSASLRDVLFAPLANVATPFFVGVPGFRRKVWLAGSHPGEFLELYEWASEADAERFVAVLQSLLRPFAFAGTASFDVVEAESVAAYVDARDVSWRAGGDRRRSRRWPRAALLLLAVAFVVGYLVGTRRRESDSPAAASGE